MRNSILLTVLILVTLVHADVRVAQQSRAVSQQMTSTIGGRVIGSTGAAQPIARAIVSINGPSLSVPRSVITDVDGRFTFDSLPSGRFSIKAEKPAFITSEYGAKRPGRPGVEIAVGEGSVVKDLTIWLARGAVVSGVLRDELGAPIASVRIRVVSVKGPAATNLLSLTNNGVRTNQLGEYRIFGIEPGSYVVQANPTIADSGLSTASEERIDRILSYLKSRTSRSLVTPLDSPAVSRSVAYVPVYYPGTPDPASALILTLASGDERPGVDFAIGGVPVATVDGTVLLEDGRPAVGAVVFLRRLEIRTGLELPAPPATAADRDGRFRISNVTPGHYRIFARFRAVESPRADVLEAYSIASEARWATANLTTSGSDVSGLRLNIGAGFTLTGQVSFDRSKLAATGSPPDPTVLGLVLRLDTGGVSVTVPVKRDGSFRISGPPAGRYKLDIKGRPISNWVPQSASVRGIDLLDIPADFAEGSTEHVIIRYTDNPAQLSGRLQTSDQRPVSDVFIIIYSSESVFWTADSRRIRAVRPASDGSFLFRDLCPGSYLLAALTDIDPGDWLQPGFLESLVASSVKVEVRAGDHLVQDLMIRKIPN